MAEKKIDWLAITERSLDRIAEFGNRAEDARTVLGLNRTLDIKVCVGEKTKLCRSVQEAAQWASNETGRVLLWSNTGRLLVAWRGQETMAEFAHIELATEAEREDADRKKSVPTFKSRLVRYWRVLTAPFRALCFWVVPANERI